ncbi:MAG TPA: HAMP domain-containing sensor histidine kinase [Gemmatimonadaceae bacterium]|nr:HAMP domain-containing sensor histidine kinase [Gemmatimonadaceae bacterium]
MTRPSRLTALTITLLVLLPALAVLQYQWVGQLGDAARERMQRNLHNAAQQFRDALDVEIARVFVSLQVHHGAGDEGYRDRYNAWASTTAYPWIVSGVFIVDAAGRDLRLRRWDPGTRTFAAAEWSGPIARVRARFESELASARSAEWTPRHVQPLSGEDSLLVAPLLHIRIGAGTPPRTLATAERVFGYTVVELNVDAIRHRLLPALAQRHFSRTEDDAYRVAIVDASNPRVVIYRSAPDVSIDPARADVSVPLFAAHPDPMVFLARGVAPDGGRHVEKRNVLVSVIREQRDDRVTTHSVVSRGGAGDGRWRLLAQHERGSLEAAVGDVRQRNLLISFGILLLMAVSIALLTLSSRRAQALAQQRMEFVAGISHELRTPVAVIHSAAENLSHGVVGDADRVRRYGEAIEKEARRLGEMVERVLHFAGIESGRISRLPLAVQPLVDQAIETALAAGGERFTVDRQFAPELPLVLGDSSALRSAVQNLITNAMKYGGPDRWMRVRAEAGPEARDSFMTVVDDRRVHLLLPRARHRIPEVRITVEDHGRGIGPEDLPHIFDPFYRGADARARQTHGSGLGLALVRRIAAAHGGRVSVTTREGAGSAFTIHLPVAAALHDKPIPFGLTKSSRAEPVA